MGERRTLVWMTSWLHTDKGEDGTLHRSPHPYADDDFMHSNCLYYVSGIQVSLNALCFKCFKRFLT